MQTKFKVGDHAYTREGNLVKIEAIATTGPRFIVRHITEVMTEDGPAEGAGIIGLEETLFNKPPTLVYDKEIKKRQEQADELVHKKKALHDELAFMEERLATVRDRYEKSKAQLEDLDPGNAVKTMQMYINGTPLYAVFLEKDDCPNLVRLHVKNAGKNGMSALYIGHDGNSPKLCVDTIADSVFYIDGTSPRIFLDKKAAQEAFMELVLSTCKGFRRPPHELIRRIRKAHLPLPKEIEDLCIKHLEKQVRCVHRLMTRVRIQLKNPKFHEYRQGLQTSEEAKQACHDLLQFLDSYNTEGDLE